MSLLALILILVAVGVVLWLVNAYVPMDGVVKRIMNIVVIVVLALVVLHALGILDELRSVRVPKL